MSSSKETRKAWREANPDKVREMRKRYYEANKEKALQYNKAWKERKKAERRAEKETQKLVKAAETEAIKAMKALEKAKREKAHASKTPGKSPELQLSNKAKARHTRSHCRACIWAWHPDMYTKITGGVIEQGQFYCCCPDAPDARYHHVVNGSDQGCIYHDSRHGMK